MDQIHVSVVILINSDSKFFVGKRPSGKPLAGLWEFPGGKIENRESPEDCAIREIKEETNFNLNKEDLEPLTLFSTKEEISDTSDNIFFNFFKCRVWQGDFSSNIYSETLWVSYKDLEKLDLPKPTRNILPYIKDNP